MQKQPRFHIRSMLVLAALFACSAGYTGQEEVSEATKVQQRATGGDNGVGEAATGSDSGLGDKVLMDPGTETQQPVATQKGLSSAATNVEQRATGGDNGVGEAATGSDSGLGDKVLKDPGTEKQQTMGSASTLEK